jgi:hypothetical protein
VVGMAVRSNDIIKESLIKSFKTMPIPVWRSPEAKEGIERYMEQKERKKVYRKSDGTYNWVEVEQPEKGEPYINDPVEHPSHYTSGSIEVWDFIIDQGLNYFEGNVIKYISRWKKKNGLEDLKKAKAYLDKMILWEEGKDGK